VSDLVYHVRERVWDEGGEGGRIVSRIDWTDGGAKVTGSIELESSEEGSSRFFEMGNATTWVANVIAEIHREERRGSKLLGNLFQNCPDRIGDFSRM
jgi:hypothetical protein